MGRTTREGVVPRVSTILIDLRNIGYGRLTLQIKPTPANLRYAERMKEEILRKHEHGVLNLAEYFPDSKFSVAPQRPTLAQVAEDWYATTLHELAPSSRLSYRRILDAFWLPKLGGKDIEDITLTQIKKALAEGTWKTNKTRNNVMIPLRGIFSAAFIDGVIKADLAARIKNLKPQRPDPDPLEFPEVELVLGWMASHLSKPVFNYYDFAIFTGLRPSEQIALRWEDVDFNSSTVKIHRAKVWGKEKETTKTYQVRHIELNSRAVAALSRQKAHTYLMGGEVFRNPNTQLAWNNTAKPLAAWHRTLKATGIRQRDAYQSRHTFATMNLMAGTNPMWVSRQLGHTNMRMTLERYSKWIDRADKSREKQKLEIFIKNFGTDLALTGPTGT